MAALGLTLAATAACAAPEQTNRELERMSRDYQRRQHEEEQASRPPVTRPASDTCGLTENAGLIGTAEADLHPPANARVICAGCMATMDFNATRLTIQMGPDHKVASMRCG